MFGTLADLAAATEFTIVCFADSTSPAAMFVAKQVATLRERGDASFARVLLLDAASPEVCDKGTEYGVVSTPAVCFLYNGRTLTVRRPGFTDAPPCTCAWEWGWGVGVEVID